MVYNSKSFFRLIRSIGLGQLFLNCIFGFFRKNSFFSFYHYSSVVVKPRKFSYHKDFITLKSLAVSPSCYFQANNGIKLGHNCLIAPGVKLISSNHDISNLNKNVIDNSEIRVGNDVWLGANSIVLPGVTIADRVVVGAGSVVTKSITVPGAIVVGNPAKIIRVV